VKSGLYNIFAMFHGVILNQSMGYCDEVISMWGYLVSRVWYCRFRVPTAFGLIPHYIIQLNF